MSLSRRRFLRGVGASMLALPMLELFGSKTAVAKASGAPRLLVYYLPNGRRPEWWVPASNGSSLTFPGQSASLQPFASRMLSLVGLDNTAARKSPGAAHAMGTATVMTGTHIPDLNGLKNGISLDQIVASELGSDSRFTSLQWSAGEPGPCDVGGSSCAYTQSISWAGHGSPLIPTIDPAAAFARLFKTGSDGLTGDAAQVRKQSMVSVLDYVNDDAKDLQGRLGYDDQMRLDEYFTALRDLEKSFAVETTGCDVPAEAPGSSLGYSERVDAFHQLIKLAFQCDQTRVLSFMIEFGLSGRSHDFLGAPGGHHALSHYGDTSAYQRLEKVEIWHAQKLAELLSLLDATSTADGKTLLDETLVLVMPSMGEGSSHDHAKNCPLLCGATGTVNTDGRQLVFNGGELLANLHVSLLSAFGIGGHFGTDGAIFGDDGNQVIAGIVS